MSHRHKMWMNHHLVDKNYSCTDMKIGIHCRCLVKDSFKDNMDKVRYKLMIIWTSHLVSKKMWGRFRISVCGQQTMVFKCSGKTIEAVWLSPSKRLNNLWIDTWNSATQTVYFQPFSTQATVTRMGTGALRMMSSHAMKWLRCSNRITHQSCGSSLISPS